MPSQRGSGVAPSRPRSAAASATAARTPSTAPSRASASAKTSVRARDAELWEAMADQLDAATIARIVKLVDEKDFKKRHPAESPAVQELRAALSGSKIPAPLRNGAFISSWYATVLEKRVAVHLTREGMVITMYPRTYSESYNYPRTHGESYKIYLSWNWKGENGVHIFEDKVQLGDERLFYAVLSVLVPRLSRFSQEITAALPTMKVHYYKKGLLNRMVHTKTPLAKRVRALYNS